MVAVNSTSMRVVFASLIWSLRLPSPLFTKFNTPVAIVVVVMLSSSIGGMEAEGPEALTTPEEKKRRGGDKGRHGGMETHGR